MESNRITSRRRARVRAADVRAGVYEQTADRPSVESMYLDVAERMGSRWTISCSGAVTRPCELTYSDLFDLAVVDGDRPDGVGVPMTDVLASIGLEVGAQILRIGRTGGEPLVIPVHAVLADPDARLVLGSTRTVLSLMDGFPARLDLADWTPCDTAVRVTSIEALTFAAFVGCP